MPTKRLIVLSAIEMSIAITLGGTIVIGVCCYVVPIAAPITPANSHERDMAFLWGSFALLCMSIVMCPLRVLRDRPYIWCLEDRFVIKRRADSPVDIVRIDLRHVISWRRQRELPIIGQCWFVVIFAYGIHYQDSTLLQWGKLKITSRNEPSGNHFYKVGPFKKAERDAFIAAISAIFAAKRGNHPLEKVQDQQQ